MESIHGLQLLGLRFERAIKASSFSALKATSICEEGGFFISESLFW
jgi:hypothetical protein